MDKEDAIWKELKKDKEDTWNKMRNIDDPEKLTDEERRKMLTLHYGVPDSEKN